MAVVYVDDFIVAGQETKIDEVTALINSVIQLDEWAEQVFVQ